MPDAIRTARLDAARTGLGPVIAAALPEDQAFVLITFDRAGTATEDVLHNAGRAEAARHLRHAAEVLELRERRGMARR